MWDTIGDLLFGIPTSNPIFEGVLGSILKICVIFCVVMIATILFVSLVATGSIAVFAAIYFLGYFVSSVLFSQDMSHASSDGLFLLGVLSIGALVIIFGIVSFLVQQARSRLGWDIT